MDSIHEPTDDVLARAAGAGDEQAFEQLFVRHRARVARLASRFFPQREQIEEIIQETFTKAYFALGDYTGAHAASFIAWLSQITVNTCYDELRRARRRPEDALADIGMEEADRFISQAHAADPGANPESAAISRDLAHKLLARLAPDDRLALILLDAEGLSVAEIAHLTGWSISKVKIRAHRARNNLRRVLRKYL